MSDLSVLGYRVYDKGLSMIGIGDKKQIINTINAYSYVVATKDDQFRASLENSDILLPDGFPIVLAAKLLRGVKIEKIAGEDVFLHLMAIANKQGRRVFFLGSSVNTLALIRKRQVNDFPGVEAGFFSPPYKPVFSTDDSKTMIDAVNSFKPDVLFVGMTAPKQEKWVRENSHQLDVKVVCSIGAVFDFYAETIKRPSKIWIKLNLEWFARFLNEPKRLFARYFYYSPFFFFDLFKAWIRK